MLEQLIKITVTETKSRYQSLTSTLFQSFTAVILTVMRDDTIACLVTVRRCFRYQAPRYLANCCVPVSEVPGCRHLHSASKLNIRRVSSQHIWHLRVFSVANSTVWNSLPDLLRDPSVKFEHFRRDLKMHLFAGH